MSMVLASCPPLTMPSTLVLFWLSSIAAGAGIALSGVRVCLMAQRHTYYTLQMKEEAARLHRKRQEEAVCLQRREQEAALDHLMDKRLDCSACWQEQHPGMRSLFFARLCLCSHHQRLLKDVVSTDQQSFIHSLPACCNSLVEVYPYDSSTGSYSAATTETTPGRSTDDPNGAGTLSPLAL